MNPLLKSLLCITLSLNTSFLLAQSVTSSDSTDSYSNISDNQNNNTNNLEENSNNGALTPSNNDTFASGVVDLGKLKDGDTVHLKQGTLLSLELSCIPSTGFSWSYLTTVPNILTLEKSVVLMINSKEENQVQNLIMGGTENQYWNFRAAHGETTLTFSLSRPWILNEPPLKKLSLTIIVD